MVDTIDLMSLLKKITEHLANRSKEKKALEKEDHLEQQPQKLKAETPPPSEDVPTTPPEPIPLEQKEKRLESMQVDFVSMASHELRTPITSLIGYLQTLNDEARSKLTEEEKSFLDRSLVSAQEILALVNNILNVSKVERGAFSVTLKPLDWSQVLEQVVSENKILASQKNISLELKLPDNLPKVLADQLRITEVLNNLINNAIVYTKAGGSVEVSTQPQEDQIITSVKDNGQGIPKEVMSHLFTKFFRVQGALDKSSSSSGSGLGLYISKSIIDLHHGKIWASSEEGKGSTFSFSLSQA